MSYNGALGGALKGARGKWADQSCHEKLVGARGLEPRTVMSRETGRRTGTRTPDPLIKSLLNSLIMALPY